MARRVSRRRLLGTGTAVVFGVVAGCQSDSDGTSTGDPSATATPAGADSGGADDSWTTWQHDVQNTGYNPDAAGPVDGASDAWTVDVGAVESSAAVVDGTVYVGSDEGYVYAFDAETGDLLWEYETGDKTDASPAVADGRVFVPARNGTLYALSTDDGGERWSVDGVGGGRLPVQQGSPTVVDGVVYLGSLDESLYGFDAETGEQVRTFDVWPDINPPETFASTPAYDDGWLYAGANSGYVWAIDLSSPGDIAWYSEVSDGSVYGGPAVHDGTVYVTSQGVTETPVVYALDAKSGDQQWAFEAAGEFQASPTVGDGNVYIGSLNGTFYAIDAADGTEQWTVETDEKIYSSAALTDDRVYFGSYDETVRAADPGTGEVAWTHDVGNNVDASLSVADGRLYVGTWGSASFYALTEA